MSAPYPGRGSRPSVACATGTGTGTGDTVVSPACGTFLRSVPFLGWPRRPRRAGPRKTRTATRPSVGTTQMPEGLQGHGGRDGNKEDADNELQESFEKWAAGRDVKTPLIGQRESGQNRRDEPGVRTENVAAGRHRDHGGELHAGAGHLVQPGAGATAARAPRCRRRRPGRPRGSGANCPPGRSGSGPSSRQPPVAG
jgi:hypothetical protein